MRSRSWHTLTRLALASLACIALSVASNAQSPAEMRQEADALFQRLLAKPNDLDATFRFASLQATLGDQEAAIGALERMLFYNPDLPRVQLELGVLYFKLGSYELARNHFEAAVANPDTPGDVRERVAAFLREIDRRVADNQLVIFGTAGLRYQSNASIGPDSQVVRALGNDAVLASQYLRKPDTNALVAGQIRHVYDFQNQRGDVWETNGALYGTQQFRLTRFNLGVVQADTGPRLALAEGVPVTVRPYVIGAFVALANRPYLTSPGVGVSARWLSVTGYAIEPGVEIASRRFYNSTPYPNATNQNGSQLSVYVNLSAPLPTFATWRILVRPYFAKADARYQPYTYNQVGVDVSFSTDFAPLTPLWTNRNWNFTVFGGVSDTVYRIPDTIVDPNVRRRDLNWRAGGLLEVSINDWLGVAIQTSYALTRSNIANFQNRNFVVSLAPTVRF